MIALISPSNPDSNWTRLCNTVVGSIPFESIGIFQTADRFSDRLRQGRGDILAAVLYAGSKNDLLHLQEIRDVFSDLKIILILPDSDPGTTRIGHTFYPRYISFTESMFEDVAAVLKKILSNTQKSPNPINAAARYKKKRRMTVPESSPTTQV